MSESAIDFQPAAAAPAGDQIDFQPAAVPAPHEGQDLRATADATADRHGIDRALFRGLIATESAWNPQADAHQHFPNSHAFGLTQLQPGTATEMGVSDLKDPTQQLEGGAKYLRQLADRYGGDWDKALAAYHDGPSKVESQGITDDTGAPYVKAVRQAADATPPAAPTTPPSTTLPASLLALQADNAGVTGGDAAEAIDLAKKTGLGQQFVADNLPQVREYSAHQDFADFLRSTPTVAEWASQSAGHAAAVKADKEPLAAMDFWFGRSVTTPLPAAQRPAAFATAGIDYPLTRTEAVQQSGLTQAYAQALFAQQANLLEMKRATFGLTPEETDRLNFANEMASAEIPGNEGVARKTATTLARAVPFLAGAVATGSAKTAQAAYLTQQNFGPFFAKLADAKDEKGAPRFTKGEARVIAGVAATASGIAMAYGGAAFLRALPGAGAALDDAVGGALVRLFTENPSVWKVLIARALQAGNHVLSGIGMMAGQGAADGALTALAKGHKFGLPSVSMGIILGQPGSEAWRDVGEGIYEGAKTGAAFFPLALYRSASDFHADLGRLRAARPAGPEVVPPEAAPEQPQLPPGPEGPTVEAEYTRNEPPAPPMRPADRARVARDLRVGYEQAKASGGNAEAWRAALVKFGVEVPPEPPPPLAGLLNDLGRAHDAEVGQVRLDELVKSANLSKLLNASADQAEDLFEAMAPPGESPRISIDALEQNPEAAAVVEKALGEDGPRAISEASETRGDVAVPMGTYLAKVAPQHHDALREDVKLTDTGMTPAEAKVFRDFMEQAQGIPGAEEAGRAFAGGIAAAAKRAGKPVEDIARRFPLSTARAQARETARTQAIKEAPTPAVADEALPAYLEAERQRMKARTAAPTSAEIAATIQRAMAPFEAPHTPSPPPTPSPERVAPTGASALVHTPQFPKGEPVRYQVIEAHDLVPSHSFRDFGPNPAYPEGVQERNYIGTTEEQLKVDEGAKRLNNQMLLTDTPSPLDGPPLVTAGATAIVLGGNGRSMMIKRAFENDPAKRDSYKADLLKRAETLGLDKAAIEQMSSPVLVREVVGLTDTADKKDLIAAVRRFNEGMTQKLSERARAIAEARTMSQRTVEDIGNLLSANGDSSLRELMRDKPLAMVELLRRGGVITPQNQTEWLTNGMLNDGAKDRIEAMFVGRVMDSEQRMNMTRPLLIAKIERIATSLLRVSGQAPKFDETATVRRAVDFINEAQARGVSLDDLLMQEQMFASAPRPAPDTIAMANMLQAMGQRSLQARFREWDDFLTGAPLFQKMPPTVENARAVLFAQPGAPKNTLFQRGVEQRNLLAMHNLTAGNLVHADELGGLVAPSVAISRSEFPLDNFGEITLIGAPDLVDPSKTPVFNADVYSPRWPNTRFKMKEKETRAFLKEIRPYATKLGTYLSDIENEFSKDGIDGVLSRRQWEATLGSAFLEEKGQPVESKMRPALLNRSYSDQPALREFFKEHGRDRNARPGEPYFEALSAAAKAAVGQYAAALDAEDEGLGDSLKADILERDFTDGKLDFGPADRILDDAEKVGTQEIDKSATEDEVLHRLNADPALKAEFTAWATAKLGALFGDRYIEKYTDQGNRRRLPYTAENLLRELVRQIRQGENFNYGPGSARALGAKQFRSLEGIKAERNRIVPHDEMERAKEALDAKLMTLADALRLHHPNSGNFGYLDAVVGVIGDSYRRGWSMERALRENGFQNVGPDGVREAKQFARDLLEMPTEYFEAKPRRVVGIHEFKAAVVPEGTPQAALDVLKKHGVPTTTYPKGDEAARAEAVRNAAKRGNVLFQGPATGGRPRLTLMGGGEGSSPQDLFDRLAAGKIEAEDLSREQLLSIAEWNDPNGTWADEREIKQLESQQKVLEGEAAKLGLTQSQLFDLGNEIYPVDRSYDPANMDDVRDMLSGVDFKAPLPAEPVANLAVKYIRAQLALERLREEWGTGPDKEDLVETIREWVKGARPVSPELDAAYVALGAYFKSIGSKEPDPRDGAVAQERLAKLKVLRDAVTEAENGGGGEALPQNVVPLHRPTRPLFQHPVEGTPLTVGVRPDRGQIAIGLPTAEGTRSFDITVFPGADESTLLHEVGHALSVILSDLAADQGAPADIVKDAETYAVFAGYANAAERHRALDPAKEEKANDAWEQFAQEGKAPTPELASVFARLKDWLTRIYQKVKTGLTDDMRAVFSRMLGGEPAPGQPETPAPEKPPAPKEEGDQQAEASLPQMMAEKYGGTVEEWTQKLSTPEASMLLKQGPVEEPPLNRSEVDDRAKALIEATKVGEIRPAKYETTAANLNQRILNFAASKVTGQVAKVRPPGEGKAIEQTVSLTDLERARDFNMALAKKAKDVKAEMAQALERVMRDATNIELRGQLGLADPAFRDVFDSINEAIGAKRRTATPDRLSMDSMLQVMKDVGLAAGFDEDATRALLERPRAWSKFTPPEARGVVDALDSIRAMAARLNMVAVGDKLQTLRDTQEMALAQNAGRKDLGAPAITRSAADWATRAPLAAAGVLNAWNLKPETAFQALGETLHQVFVKTIDARNAKWEMQGSILKHFVEKVRDLGWMKEPIDTDLRLPQIGDMLLQPPEDTNEDRQASRPLPQALARSYGSTPEAWEKLLNSDQTLEDMPTVKEIIERGRRELAASRSIQSVPDLSREMNKETIAMIFLNLGNPGNEQRLTSGYNWSGRKLREEIGKHLTPEQCAQLQAVLDLLTDELWPKIRAHAEKTTGLAPPKVPAQPITITFANGETHTFAGGYFPLAPHPDALNVPVHGHEERGVTQYDRAARMTVEASFIKTRASRATYPVDLNWSRVGKHIDGVLHYLAYDQPVRDIGQLLKDDRIASIIRHSVGDPELRAIRSWHALLARGKQDSIGFFDSVVRNTLRSRAISNYLAFSAPIAIMQLSHIPYAVTAGEISAKNTALAAARQIPYTDAWEATRNASTELQFRSTRWAHLYRQAISGESSELTGKVGQWADKAGFLHMEAADALLSHIIFDAALNDAIGDRNMEHEDAVQYANAKVRLLMPTHNIFEMAPIVRDRGALGALMLFRGLPNVVWNVNYGLYDRARQARYAAKQRLRLGPGEPQELVAGGITEEPGEGPTIEMENEGAGVFGMRAKGRVLTATNMARAAAAAAVLAVLGKFLDGLGKDRDDGRGLEGWASWALRLAIGGQLEAVPMGRDIGQPLVDAAIQGKSIGWAVEKMKRSIPEVETVLGVLTDLGHVAAKHSTDEQRVKGALSAALTVAGYGGRPLAATGERIYDALAGKLDLRGPFDALDLATYPTRELTKTPLTTFQDVISGEKPLPRHLPRR